MRVDVSDRNSYWRRAALLLTRVHRRRMRRKRRRLRHLEDRRKCSTKCVQVLIVVCVVLFHVGEEIGKHVKGIVKSKRAACEERTIVDRWLNKVRVVVFGSALRIRQKFVRLQQGSVAHSKQNLTTSLIALNFSSASAESFLSGWYINANRRYAFLMSASEQLCGISSIAYASISGCKRY
jgi:hypothetical protein